MSRNALGDISYFQYQQKNFEFKVRPMADNVYNILHPLKIRASVYCNFFTIIMSYNLQTVINGFKLKYFQALSFLFRRLKIKILDGVISFVGYFKLY